jgi:hypothetical protein
MEKTVFCEDVKNAWTQSVSKSHQDGFQALAAHGAFTDDFIRLLPPRSARWRPPAGGRAGVEQQSRLSPKRLIIASISVMGWPSSVMALTVARGRAIIEISARMVFVVGNPHADVGAAVTPASAPAGFER